MDYDPVAVTLLLDTILTEGACGCGSAHPVPEPKLQGGWPHLDVWQRIQRLAIQIKEDARLP